MAHVSVLTKEVLDGLALTPRSVVIDCTLGAGGHTNAVLKALGLEGRVVSLDADQSAISSYEKAYPVDARLTLVPANFRDLKRVVEEVSIQPTAIMADLGWRSEQFALGSGKGFSFTADEPLLMTYGDAIDYTFTAYDVVNNWSEASLADVIYGYGEERYARRIAAAIVAARAAGEITTASQLAEIVAQATPTRYQRGHLHPATRTFQAIRIAVNDELGALESLLNDAPDLLTTGGRLAVISFHSLEDRLVKRAFRSLVHDQRGQLVTKKPITATDEETLANPRARSAKLRIIEITS